jgi:FkbM family methyltransferase
MLFEMFYKMAQTLDKKKIIIILGSCILLFGIYCLFDLKVEQLNENPSFVLTRPKQFVYIDLGANTGDSVYNFFNVQSNYPKILNTTEVEKNDWVVFAFEANPQFNNQLDAMKNKLENPKRKINLYKSTAAWIYNGNITFYLDTVNKGNNFWGSSLDPTHPDVVASNKTKINVPCVDIADVLQKFNKQDTIVLKIDIEGAEYDLLVHLIVRKVLDLIDFLAIEYHGYKFGKTKGGEDIILNKIFEQSNVKFFNWV